MASQQLHQPQRKSILKPVRHGQQEHHKISNEIHQQPDNNQNIELPPMPVKLIHHTPKNRQKTRIAKNKVVPILDQQTPSVVEQRDQQRASPSRRQSIMVKLDVRNQSPQPHMKDRRRASKLHTINQDNSSKPINKAAIALSNERRMSQRLDEQLILGINNRNQADRRRTTVVNPHKREERGLTFLNNKSSKNPTRLHAHHRMANDSDDDTDGNGVNNNSFDYWEVDENSIDKNLIREYEIAAEEQTQRAQATYNRMYTVQLKTDLQAFQEAFDHHRFFFYSYIEWVLKLKELISDTCLKIVKSNKFENMILLTIIFNSVMLMLDDPTSDDQTDFQSFTEDFFLWAYTAEAALKIIGFGFIKPKNAYLRDGWNILDFIIVVSSLLPLIIGSSTINLKALRSLRILRPLRTISTVKKLKILLRTLFSAIPYLVNTMIILVFFFLIFAIGGLQLFGGLLLRRCIEESTGIIIGTDQTCGGEYSCATGYSCGKTMQNPQFTVTSFDNIFYSFLMVFQIITMEGWTTIMFEIFDAFSIFAVLYFVLLIFIGSFFLLNLTLAVIKAKFSDNSVSGDKTANDVSATQIVDEDGQKVNNPEMRLDILKAYRKVQRDFRIKQQSNHDHEYPWLHSSFQSNPRGFAWDDLQRLRTLQRIMRAESKQQQEILSKQFFVAAWRKKLTERIQSASKRIFKSYRVITNPVLPSQRIIVYPSTMSTSAKPVVFMGLQKKQLIIQTDQERQMQNTDYDKEAEEKSEAEFWQEIEKNNVPRTTPKQHLDSNRDMQSLPSFGFKSQESNMQLTTKANTPRRSMMRQSLGSFSLANLKNKIRSVTPSSEDVTKFFTPSNGKHTKNNLSEQSATKLLNSMMDDKTPPGTLELTPRMNVAPTLGNNNHSSTTNNGTTTEEALISDKLDEDCDSMLSSLSIVDKFSTSIQQIASQHRYQTPQRRMQEKVETNATELKEHMIYLPNGIGEQQTSRRNSQESLPNEEVAVKSLIHDPDFYTFSHSNSMKSMGSFQDDDQMEYLTQALREIKQSQSHNKDQQSLKHIPQIREEGNILHVISSAISRESKMMGAAAQPSSSASSSTEPSPTKISLYRQSQQQLRNHRYSIQKTGSFGKLKSQSEIGVIQENEDEEQQEDLVLLPAQTHAPTTQKEQQTQQSQSQLLNPIEYRRQKKLLETQWLNERIKELQDRYNELHSHHRHQSDLADQIILESQAMIIERAQRIAREKEQRAIEDRMIRHVSQWTIGVIDGDDDDDDHDRFWSSKRDVLKDKIDIAHQEAERAAEQLAFRKKQYVIYHRPRQAQLVAKTKRGKRNAKKQKKLNRSQMKLQQSSQKLTTDRLKKMRELQKKYNEMKLKAAAAAAAASAAGAMTIAIIQPPPSIRDNKSVINFANPVTPSHLVQLEPSLHPTPSLLFAPPNNHSNIESAGQLRSLQAANQFNLEMGLPPLSLSSFSKSHNNNFSDNQSQSNFSSEFQNAYTKIPNRQNKWISLIESHQDSAHPSSQSLQTSQQFGSHTNISRIKNQQSTGAFSLDSSRFLQSSNSQYHGYAQSRNVTKKPKVFNQKEMRKQQQQHQQQLSVVLDLPRVTQLIYAEVEADDAIQFNEESPKHEHLAQLVINIISFFFYLLSNEPYIQFKREDFNSGVKTKKIFSGVDVKRGRFIGGVSHLNKILLPLNSVKQKTLMWLPGIIGLLRILHYKIYSFAVSDLFGTMATLAVFGNTFVLALDGSFSDDATLNLLDQLNTAFSYLFIAEMAIKVIGLTPAGYIRDRMNIFDGLIVSLSIFELLFMSGGSKAVSAFRAVRIFRTFRVLRVTRLLRGLQFMGKIIKVINKTLDSFVYIALLLFLFIFIFSLLGMQLYGGDFPVVDSRVRQNFDSFQNAFISIFQIMTMENWNDILYKAFNSQVNKFLSAIFMIIWIFIGNWIFLNLFLAILLDGFTDTADDDDDQEIDEETLELAVEEPTNPTHNDAKLESNVKNAVDLPLNQANLKELDQGEAFERMDTEEMEALEQEILKLEGKNALLHANGFLSVVFTDVNCEQSLFVFSKENVLRRFCYACIKHPKFESIILFFIITSSLKLIVDTYVEDGSDLDNKLKIVDFAFNGIFIAEATLKIISLGFFVDDNSYLSESWSQIDFFIVFTSIIDMSFDGINISFLKILRLLRTLRPLRFISHNANMKVVVIALFESVSGIINVLIVIMLIWLMFAILGISLIGSRMGYCKGATSVYNINIDMCTQMGYEWATYDTNYDNILNAMRTLYVISSLEGWPDLMYQAIDSNTSDTGPVKDNYIIISYFYIVFILVGSFFLVNLFVGVIFLNFNEAQKNESQSSLFLTDDQKRWIEFQQMIIGVKAEFSANPMPTQPLRKAAFRLAHSNKFEIFIMILIVLNIVSMGMTYEGSSSSWDSMLETINLVFTIFFIAELCLKVAALGPSTFWRSGWNKFDFFVVASSVFDILLSQLGLFSASFLRIGPQLIRIVRVFRVSRLLKLVKSMKGLQKLIETLLFSLPSLINVGALLLLVFFIYSVLGVFLFKDVRTGDVINEFNNFSDFGFAMLTLFRCSTGENWYQFMFDCGKTTDCTPGVDCGSPFSWVFFVTFILICSFIMLNLFILIIIQYFEDYHMKDDNPLQAFNDKLEIFRITWARFTKKTYGEKINSNDIVAFLYDLPQPLGYYNPNANGTSSRQVSKKQIAKDVMNWGLPLQNENQEGYVFFNDMLFGCMRKEYGSKLLQNAGPEIQRMLNKLEVETRLKIAEKKKKMILRKNKKLFTDMEARQQYGATATGVKTKRANPLIAFMFLQMAFKAWHRYSDDPSAHENSDSSYEEEIDRQNADSRRNSSSSNNNNNNNQISDADEEEESAEYSRNQSNPLDDYNQNENHDNTPMDTSSRKINTAAAAAAAITTSYGRQVSSKHQYLNQELPPPSSSDTDSSESSEENDSSDSSDSEHSAAGEGQ